jgi:ribosomal protein S27AE
VNFWMYLRGIRRKNQCPKCGTKMKFDRERWLMGYSVRYYCPKCDEAKHAK